MIYIPYQQLKQEFESVLLSLSFPEEKAALCAETFANNSRDGVYSHGLNRFPSFVEDVKRGTVKPQQEAIRKEQNGQMEIWDGQAGAGIVNAKKCMDRAIKLSKEKGVGLVSLRNTNHWLRGGTYGWQAAEAGCIGICFTNAPAAMPAWGGKQPRLGNNPLVIAVPRKEGHLVLDMAISQFSYGKMQEYKFKEKPLPFVGGYDNNDQLTNDPTTILENKRALPIGLWKGSGLSLMIDVLLSALTGSASYVADTYEQKGVGVAQCFISLHNEHFHPQFIEEILSFTTSDQTGDSLFYPGERTLMTRRENMEKGIPVNEKIWNSVTEMMK